MNKLILSLVGLLLLATPALAQNTIPYESGTSGLTSGNLVKSGATVGQLQDAGIAASSVGTVTSITCNSGLSGGAITTTGTCSLNVGNANTWTAAQTITNSDLLLLGSSTGYTTFTSANASATNYTLTFPAITSTVMTLGGTSQAFSGGVLLTPNSIGVVTTGTTTINCGLGPNQWMVDGGASTIAAPTADSGCTVNIINGGSFGTISYSGFREGTNTGDTVPTTDRVTNTATFTNSSASIGVTNTAIANDPVYFSNSGGALPTNFVSGTVYYVLSTGLTTSNIEVAATPGGSAITAGSAGTGTQTMHEASSWSMVINRTNGLSHYLVTAHQ